MNYDLIIRLLFVAAAVLAVVSIRASVRAALPKITALKEKLDAYDD